MHHFLILGGDPRQLYPSGLLEQAARKYPYTMKIPPFP